MSNKIIKNTMPSELIKIKEKIQELSNTGKRFYLALDTETTGNAKDDLLTSFGAVLVDEEMNKILEFETFFNPLQKNKELEKKYKGSDAEKITKISKDFLEGKSPLIGTDMKISDKALGFEEYAEILSEILLLPNIIKIAHNKTFDMRMLENQYKNLDKHYFSTKNQLWIDSEDVFKKIKEEKKEETLLKLFSDIIPKEEAKELLSNIKSKNNKLQKNMTEKYETEKIKQLENIFTNVNKQFKEIKTNLDSFDKFVSSLLKEEEFKRTIDGKEMHGALIDSIMLVKTIEGYLKLKKSGYIKNDILKKLIEDSLKNSNYEEYQESKRILNLNKSMKDLIAFDKNNKGTPIIRTSASAKTNADTKEVVLSSIRIEDLKDIFKELIENGQEEVIISDYASIANMINIEDEIIKFNKKQKELNKPTIKAQIGICLFVKNEEGMKTEIDFIPKTKEDFKKVPKIQEKAFLNEEIEPYIKATDLKEEIFKGFEIFTNGFKDIFNRGYEKKDIKNFLSELKNNFTNIKIAMFHENKETMKEKEQIAKELNIETITTNNISYTDLLTHVIHSRASTKNGERYINEEDLKEEAESFKIEKKKPKIVFYEAIDEDSRFIPKDEVKIPNPFEYGLKFIKEKIPLIWERIEKYNLIDKTKNLEDQDIEYITREYLRNLTYEGLENRAKQKKWSVEEIEKYKVAIEKELEVINEMKFNGFTSFVEYFTNGEIKGKGRGSAAGSVVSYLIGITDIQPLKHDLIFERYLNIYRKGFPDIDMDFADRNDVIERKLKPFLEEDENFVKYILTISTAGIKSAVAEVCKFLGEEELYKTGLMEGYKSGSPSVYVSNKILGKNFDAPGTKLSDVLGNEDFEDFNKLYRENEQVRKIIDLSGKREGVVTGYGVHAAGIILKTVLENYLNSGPIINGSRMTPIGGKIIEHYIGIKMDFLGLNSLNLIEDIKNVILETMGEEEYRKIEEVFENYEDKMINDKKVKKLIEEVNMGYIFQYSSELMKKIIKRMKVTEKDEVLEIMAMISAIGRPGADSESVINNRLDPENNMELVKKYPALKEILKTTYGEIVYEEQIMSVFKELGGFNMGEAGVAQKQLSKKVSLEELKEKFLEKDKSLKDLFEHMLDNSGYSFNKSHAISYAVTSMMLMYLKAHYKEEFYIGLLNNKVNKKDEIPKIISDMKNPLNNINIEGIDINISEIETAKKQGKIYLGLSFIKGSRSEDIKKVIEERKNGKYLNIEDLKKRTKLSIKAMETLGFSGALDNLIKGNQKKEEKRIEVLKTISPKKDFSIKELLNNEYNSTGAYLHLNHPLNNDILKENLKKEGYKSLADLSKLSKYQKEYKFYAMPTEIGKKTSSKGNEIYRGNITDDIGNEVFVIGMAKDLDKDSKIALEQKEEPVKLTASISFDKNTGDRSVFISKAEIIKAKIEQKEVKKAEDIKIEGKIVKTEAIKEGKEKGKFLIEIKDINNNIQYNCILKKESWVGVASKTKLLNANIELKGEKNGDFIEVSEILEIKENSNYLEIIVEGSYTKIIGERTKDLEKYLKKIKEAGFITYEEEKDMWIFKTQTDNKNEEENIKRINTLIKRIKEKFPYKETILKIDTEETSEEEISILLSDEFIKIKNLKNKGLINRLQKVQEKDLIFFDKKDKTWNIRVKDKNKKYTSKDIKYNKDVIKTIKKELGIPEEVEKIKTVKKIAKKNDCLVFDNNTREKLCNMLIIQEDIPTSIKENKEKGHELLEEEYFDYMDSQEQNKKYSKLLIVLNNGKKKDKLLSILAKINEGVKIIMPIPSKDLKKELNLKNGMNKLKIEGKEYKIFIPSKENLDNIIKTMEESLKKNGKKSKNNGRNP